MDIGAKKAELRRKIRAERRSLDKAKRREWDEAIAKRVMGLKEYKEAKTVFCFVSMAGEPQTKAILENALKSGKRLAVPRCLDDGEMEAVVITSLSQLEPGTMGILEPVYGLATVDFEDIDMAVVPGLAFTASGERLGQGGGFYDRFMARTHAFTCGICYGVFVYDSLPLDELDMAVKAVVTEG